MKISKVTIRNILGIEHLEFSPTGQLTEITGSNGQGKTSVLEAIRSVAGGSDATLLRKGADKGEVVLLLDDGTELINKVTAAESTKIVVRDGKKVAKPATAIRELLDLLSVNPVDFLNAQKKDRVKVLLESMPIEIDTDYLSQIARYPVEVSAGVHPLALIEHVRKTIYEDRTGTNRAVREKEATINQLEQALPDLPEGAVSGNEDELNTQLETARQAATAEAERIAKKIDQVRIDNQAAIDKVRADTQAEVDRLRAAEQASIDAIKANLANIEGLAARQKEKNRDKFNAAADPIKATLAAIKANRDTYAKREQSVAFIGQMKTELTDLVQDVALQTKSLDDIDIYKAQLLDNLPIKGLEVVDGEVVRDGIPFDRLNTAQKVDIAIQIAKLRAGELAICCIDGMELMDAGAFQQFREQAEESGLQLFVTRVTNNSFSVNGHAS